MSAKDSIFRRYPFAVAMFVLCSLCASKAHGDPQACRNIKLLDRALATNDQSYFSGWTERNYVEAGEWIHHCAAGYWNYADSHRETLLAMQHRSYTVAQQKRAQAAYEAQVAQKKEERDRAAVDEQHNREVAEEAKNIKQAELADCKRRPAFEAFMAQELVIEARERKEVAQQMLTRERRIATASGAESLSVEHFAGEELIQAEDDLAVDWALYRKFGGKAKSVAQVSHTLTDPCS